MSERLRELRRYAERYPRRVFVETGIYQGGCSAHGLLDLFESLIVIDVDLTNCERAEGAGGGKLAAFHGDSAVLLPELLPRLAEPALFWLDAHAIGEEEGCPPCPILAELAAIKAWPYGADSVVLIDDVRMYGVTHDWPPLGQVVDSARERWHVDVYGDIVRCTPAGEQALQPVDAAGRPTR